MLEVGLFVLGVVVALIGYLLRQKDAEQGSKIDLLFSKHDNDAAALQELRLQIARDHYQKEELDARFARLEAAFQKGFDDLGRKFDRLSDVLLQHMHEDNNSKGRNGHAD